MNIYALGGHRVICSTYSAGYDYQSKKVREMMEIGEIYTVDYTIVHSSSTEVFLKEFPNESFNSVFFEDVEEQSEENDARHPHYHLYN